MQASELITRSLRLINVPGRGKALSGTDQQQAFESLQDLVASQAVSQQFVPGIRRHFFLMTSAKAIYSYGPGKDFDTDDFYDPAPIRIEDAYVRSGVTITRNEKLTSWQFLAATGWTLGAGWTIANGKATIATGNAGSDLTQTLSLEAGKIYTVIVNVAHRAGSVSFKINQDGSPILTQSLAGGGEYSFEFTYAGATAGVEVEAAADADLDLLDVSVIESGLDRVSLPDGGGSDYHVSVLDAREYNREFSKGVGGRPYSILYSREWNRGELRCDNAATAGDILVMDVLVNSAELVDLSSQVRVTPETIRWLKFALADEVAGEYGKQLRPRQVEQMEDAYHSMSSVNIRPRKLRVDPALQRRTRFNINRGDP